MIVHAEKGKMRRRVVGGWFDLVGADGEEGKECEFEVCRNIPSM